MDTKTLKQSDLNTIVDMVSNHTVCAISAPAGLGKSTILVEELKKKCEIIYVVQPTIASVLSLTRFMKKKTKGSLGSAAEGDIKYKNDFLAAIRSGKHPGRLSRGTSIVYCTSGHMRRVWIDCLKYCLTYGANRANLGFCDVLIVDESHLGTLDADVILYLWNYARNLGALIPRLLLSSATLSLTNTPFPTIPCHVVETKSYPVDIEYHGKDFALGSHAVYIEVAKVLFARHVSYLKKNSGEEKKGSDKGETGAWMVFCPGKHEVEIVCHELEELKDETMEIIPAYAELESGELEKIFNEPQGKRKIIVSTNVTETSVTIDNLSGIFDTMTEKYGDTSDAGGIKLTLSSVSRASATQRAGRTGRTLPGFCYRMCSKAFFDQLESHRSPELDRVPLDSLVIELCNIGLEPSDVFGSAIDANKVAISTKLLTELGMMDAHKKITKRGAFASLFPLSIYASAFLHDWRREKKPLFPAISYVCLVDCFGPPYFYFPPHKEGEIVTNEEYYKKHFAEYEGESDIEVLLNMWNGLIKTNKSLFLTFGALKKYCREKSLNRKKIAECLALVRQVINICLKFGEDIKIGSFNPKNFIKAALPSLLQVYKDRIFKRSSTQIRGNYVYTNGLIKYMIDNRIMLCRKRVENERIIGLITLETRTKNNPSSHRYITLCLPVPEEKGKEKREEDEEERKGGVDDDEVISGLPLPEF
jgi:HrpA-like RNA helicase